MIAAVDRLIAEWVHSVLHGLSAPADVLLDGVAVEPTPDDLSAARRRSDASPLKVLVRLISAEPAAPMTSRGLDLCYRVEVQGEDPFEAHEALGHLLVSAMDHPRVTLRSGQRPLNADSAEPRPCSFEITARADVPTRRRDAPPVRGPAVMRNCPLVAYRGTLLGPDELPAQRAEISVPYLNISTRTDQHGRFRLPPLPAQPPLRFLDVRLPTRPSVRMPVQRDPVNGEITVQLASKPAERPAADAAVAIPD